MQNKALFILREAYQTTVGLVQQWVWLKTGLNAASTFVWPFSFCNKLDFINLATVITMNF